MQSGSGIVPKAVEDCCVKLLELDCVYLAGIAGGKSKRRRN